MVQKFANFAQSTLQQSTSAVDTTMFIDPTEATQFPILGTGDTCRAMVYDQKNKSELPEILDITAILGGQLTVVRAREGSAARNWPAGSRLRASLTAAAIESALAATFVQSTWTGTPSGTNAYVVTVVGGVPVPNPADEVIFNIPNTNTIVGATLAVTNGNTTTGPFPIKMPNGADPSPGDMAQNFIAVVRWDAGPGNWRLVVQPSGRLQISSINSGPIEEGNVIGNGDFSGWFNGVSFATPASGTQTADGWRIDYDGTIGTFTISRQAFTPGQTDVPGDPLFFHRWDHTVAGTGSTFRNMSQRIPKNQGAAWRAGDQVTFSIWAKADASRSVTVAARQFFGTGGSPSAQVDTSFPVLNLTTAWQRFVRTVTLPSVSGKTFGTNQDSRVELILVQPVNTTMVLDYVHVRLEAGSLAADEGSTYPWPQNRGGTGFTAIDTADLLTKLGVVGIGNLLTAILAIDGSGSGIDADLLDGVSGSGYVQTTGTQTVGGVKTFTANNIFEGAAPVVYIRETDQAADEKVWGWRLVNGDLFISTFADALTLGVDLCQVVRGTGTAITSIAFGNIAFTINGNQVFHAGSAPSLAQIEGLVGTGFSAQVAADDWELRSLVAPAAGITITNPAGVAGNPTFALANDLAAVEGLAGTGFAVRTGSDAWTNRSLTAGSGIAIGNPSGAGANPDIAVDATVVRTTGAQSIAGIKTLTDDLVLDTDTTPTADTSAGYRRLAPASVTSGTPIAADSGKCIYTSGNVTAPSGVFAKGDWFAVMDDDGVARTITPDGGLTLRLHGSTATGVRNLAVWDMAIVLYLSSSLAVCFGGVS